MSSTIKVPIDAIVWPEVRASSKFTPEQLEFFKATVEEFGVIQDPVVRPLEPGKFEGVAGKTRWQELKDKGDTEISVKLIDADERTAMFMHLAENVARGSVDLISIAGVMRKLSTSGASISELSRVLGKSETWVRRTLALLELPEVYQDAIADGRLTPTHVYLAARMPTPYETDDALKTALTHEWNTSVFETFVTNRLAQLAAAKKVAAEKGVDFVAPPVEPEKLISYVQCLVCGYRVPREKTSIQIVCEGCQELAHYITSQLGPWEKCKDTVFTALQLYFGQRDRDRAMPIAPSPDASQEKTVSSEQLREP